MDQSLVVLIDSLLVVIPESEMALRDDLSHKRRSLEFLELPEARSYYVREIHYLLCQEINSGNVDSGSVKAVWNNFFTLPDVVHIPPPIEICGNTTALIQGLARAKDICQTFVAKEE